MPRQFSWIDQRLVRDGHISRCTTNALALYLLLCTVADAQGLSYYSDPRAASLLSVSESELTRDSYNSPWGEITVAGHRTAQRSRRATLRGPHRLSEAFLPGPEPGTSSGARGAAAAPRTGQPLSLADILRQMKEEG